MVKNLRQTVKPQKKSKCQDRKSKQYALKSENLQ